MTQNTLPAVDLTAFNCPSCGVLTTQEWFRIQVKNKHDSKVGITSSSRFISGIEVVECFHCKEFSIWLNNKMIYPNSGSTPIANSDMPIDIKQVYDEARSILEFSPRGAAALLRLVVQKLCIHLGEVGKKIDDDIKSLVKKGLSEKVQKSLDIVRVVGNNAVHPGIIDLTDNKEIASKLFVLINIICDALITQPKNINESYENIIPGNSKKAIDKRDGHL